MKNDADAGKRRESQQKWLTNFGRQKWREVEKISAVQPIFSGRSYLPQRPDNMLLLPCKTEKSSQHLEEEEEQKKILP